MPPDAASSRDRPDAERPPAAEPPLRRSSPAAPVAAPAIPSHAAGALGPVVARALQTGAGNAAVVGLLQSSGVLQRKRTGAAPPPETDPLSDLVSLATQLRGEELPAFQRALDALDVAAVEEVGLRIGMVWSAVEAAHGSLAGAGTALPEYERLSEHVVQAAGTQSFRGAGVLGSPQAVKPETDVQAQLDRQVKAAATTVRNTAELLKLLRLPERTEEQEAQAVTAAPAPQPVAAGLHASRRTRGGARHRPRELRARPAAEALAPARGAGIPAQLRRVGPADRVGMFEARPLERAVVVLQPYGAREIALELYGDLSFYERVLLPYNRALAAIEPDGWVPAGTRLVVEPRLLTVTLDRVHDRRDGQGAARRPAAAGDARRDRDQGHRDPLRRPLDGAKRQPDLVLEPPPGIDLVLDPVLPKWADVEWEVLHDPVAVADSKAPESEWLGSDTHVFEDLQGEKGVSIEHAWPALGTHTVVCRVTPGPRDPFMAIDDETMELRHPQPVLTRAEKVAADWLTVDDPREMSVFGPPDSFGSVHAAAEAAGVTDEELLANPLLAKRLGVEMHPEFLLQELAAGAMRARATGSARTSRRTSPPSRARWRRRGCSACAPEGPVRVRRLREDGVVPAQPVRVARPGRRVAHLAVLYDMSMPGDPREYHGGRFQPTFDAAIDVLLEQFADDAPYPTGTVRFHVDSALLPPDMTFDRYPLRRGP